MHFEFADKPAGVTTHTSENEEDHARGAVKARARDGFKEHLEERLGYPLFVVHRLDRETTGAIVFARTKESAADLSKIFATREAKKRYLFLSDRKPSQDLAEGKFVASFIERRGNEFVSLSQNDHKLNSTTDKTTEVSTDEAASELNAHTYFRLLNEKDGIYLWEALPQTGRPHQIRLHARDSGIPLLGDTRYGGTSSAALCLHSESIEFTHQGTTYVHRTPMPVWFDSQSLSVKRQEDLYRWQVAGDRRARLIRSGAIDHSRDVHSSTRTVRWIHSDGDPLRVEQLGDVLVAGWFSDEAMTVGSKEEIENGAWDGRSATQLEQFRSLAESIGAKHFLVQQRTDRGKAPNESAFLAHSDGYPEKWVGEENGLKFEFRANSGLSPGLFLDQRRNRKWVLENSRGKSVLNLFCYTGGFSVCAAHGGATKAVSVDLSKTFLEWAKINFGLNQLSLEGHEFRAIDSRVYLDWAAKKGLKFDLVICDPPSFSRGPEGVWRIEKDFASLIDKLLKVTSRGGRILLSSNYEGWDLEKYSAKVREAVGRKGTLLPTPSADWDFELPRENPNMKSLFIDV